ncbi:MAG: LD-carboxypeptidase [Cyclobacteriaceae bacterium]
MDRRHFLKAGALVGVTPAFSFPQQQRVVKPARLPKNPTVGLIAPASALTRSAFEKTISNMEMLGFAVKYSDNLRNRSGFLSGTDQQRIEDLHEMFADPQVDAVMCARGGYGTTRLLDEIDFEVIRNNPKPFIGYSDITALFSAFYKHCGLVGFHGPVGASSLNDFSADYLFDVLEKGKKVKIKAEEPEIITSGTAEGKLIGGNLSLLTSLIGTNHDVNYKDHIVFIEEVGESTYRVDRMLTQMVSAGKFEGAKGIALGYFTDCDTSPDDPYYEFSIGLSEVFKDRLGDLGIPVVTGFPFGHEPHNATLPIGIEALLDADKGMIKLLETAVN